MELRDKIIARMEEEGIASKELINIVISDAFAQANKATKTNKEVEISGLGKFVYNERKAEKSHKALSIALDRTSSPLKRKMIEELIKYIESKRNECTERIPEANS